MASAPKLEKRPATYADLEAVPPHLVAEIIFGALVTHPRPAPPHSSASNSLGHEITGPFQKGRGGPGGWVFFTEPELHLGPHVVVPDIAGWRRERLPHMPTTAFFETPPDWVCEFLSSSTENTDRGPKRRIYATYGVAYMWFVDPVARRLEAFELRDGRWVLHETFDGEDEVKAPPFDAVPIAIAALWPLEPAPDQT
jgi:Uma2 family endonuclease